MRVWTWRVFVPFSPNICSHLWSELFRATEKLRNCPCLAQLTINQLHVWMMRGLGVWRSFDTAPNAVHEQKNPSGLAGERSRRAGKLLKSAPGSWFFFKNFFSKTAARHNSEYVTLIKKIGKRAGLPKRVHSPRVLIHTCAGGGWRTQHAHRNCSFFLFWFLFFFFLTQVRQVKVVFLRTLRNAATRLCMCVELVSSEQVQHWF